PVLSMNILLLHPSWRTRRPRHCSCSSAASFSCDERHRPRRQPHRSTRTPRTSELGDHQCLRPSRPRFPARFGHTVRDGAAMSLFDELDTYLQQRRNLGYELKTTEYLLRSFCHWMAERGNTRTFSTDDALEWATSRPNTADVWSTQRLTAVRPFAAWLNARGHDVPLI